MSYRCSCPVSISRPSLEKQPAEPVTSGEEDEDYQHHRDRDDRDHGEYRGTVVVHRCLVALGGMRSIIADESKQLTYKIYRPSSQYYSLGSLRTGPVASRGERPFRARLALDARKAELSR